MATTDMNGRVTEATVLQAFREPDPGRPDYIPNPMGLTEVMASTYRVVEGRFFHPSPYEGTAEALARAGMSKATVQRMLDSLVQAGDLVAVRGSECAGLGLSDFGLQARGTYYVTAATLGVARERHAARRRAQRRSRIRQEAERRVLTTYADEVDHIEVVLLDAEGLR